MSRDPSAALDRPLPWALAVLGAALLACGTVPRPRPGADGRALPTFQDDLHTTANQVPRFVMGARRAGCDVKENDDHSFSAKCKVGEREIVVACLQHGMILTRGCLAGTETEVCRTVWEGVLAKVDPS